MDPRLLAGVGKAGVSQVALRVLLVGIVQAGPDVELQWVLELSLGFSQQPVSRGRAQCPPMPFRAGRGVTEDSTLFH